MPDLLAFVQVWWIAPLMGLTGFVVGRGLRVSEAQLRAEVAVCRERHAAEIQFWQVMLAKLSSVGRQTTSPPPSSAQSGTPAS